MASVLVTTRKIDGSKLGHHIADVCPVRSIPPANSLEGCVRSLPAVACVVVLTGLGSLAAPGPACVVWLGLAVG